MNPDTETNENMDFLFLECYVSKEVDKNFKLSKGMSNYV